jgi:hypothetical protein
VTIGRVIMQSSSKLFVCLSWFRVGLRRDAVFLQVRSQDSDVLQAAVQTLAVEAAYNDQLMSLCGVSFYSRHHAV